MTRRVQFLGGLNRRSFLMASLGGTMALPGWAASTPEPLLLKAPGDGLQPQTAVDRDGRMHLVYLSGDPAAADVFYAWKSSAESGFSTPIRVNDQAGSAIALGTVRGVHLALGHAGRVHVAWNGSNKAAPKAARNSTPMVYARMNDAGTAFEPSRNLMSRSSALDGGGTVAADTQGNVYVTWHGQGAQDGEPAEGEGFRRVWLAVSRDGGHTFAGEVAISPAETGVCGCCGMGALCDGQGGLYLLYRSARETVHRDMYLMVSRDLGKTFTTTKLDDWETGGCPMSTVSLTASRGRVYFAWEREKQVYFASMEAGELTPGPIVAAPGSGPNRKHPSLAVNSKGEVLLLWTEGTGWQKGGTITGQLFDLGGKPIGEPLSPRPVSSWNFASAASVRGRFEIVS